ncbi:MYND finger [Colletotrichum karsti]|uniref:MYND finger n=1 Tax=Colletotrichum karsti TaxID=1095194 RepID=A0A9P6I838_9PEZI|nr:MYND finger [Colletotrichum karsti]KAF9877610.1 MYND finger [Colletotrichum karsti]
MIPRQCAVCSSRSRLQRCAGCQVVYYCGRDHQTSCWATHKRACTKVKKSRENYLKEEAKIRNAEEFGWGWTWESAQGHFWGIVETRDYMRARYNYCDIMLEVDTVDAVEKSVEHHFEMLKLCRSDNMGIRDVTPHLLLRLGRDQDTYDFTKWWATTGSESDYDWGDVSLPHLHLKGENVLEAVDVKQFSSLSHSVATALLKIRLFMDLRDVRNADHALGVALPREIVDMIKNRVPRTDVVAARRDLLKDTAGTVPLMRDLQKQIRKLVVSVAEHNKYMWTHILNPASFGQAMNSPYSMGSHEEALLVLNYCYPAWAETPGSVEVVKRAGRRT